MKNFKLLIASNNQHKLKEIREILGDKFAEVFSLSDLNINVDPDETGATFYENAKIKVDEIAKYAPAGHAILADDSGLCVNALGGLPGVHSARFSGEHGNDAANIRKLLSELDGKADRTAYFVCSMVLRMPNGDYVTAEGRTYGSILFATEGNGGFGYDPVFFSDDLKKSFGVATADEKNGVSHRGRALNALSEKLAAYRTES